jgi:hypothetical protein
VEDGDRTRLAQIECTIGVTNVSNATGSAILETTLKYRSTKLVVGFK